MSQPDPERSPGSADIEMDRAAAEEFLELFHAENPQAGPMGPRIAAVMREIDMTGTYWHTAEELAFGARAAWRNNARCIGRLYWRSLQVRDLRTVSDAGGVAGHCFEHLRAANNGGKIRP
ncbi:MAG: nitric oxide synthase oxygenase, partial [Nocardioidaceae bacterium]